MFIGIASYSFGFLVEAALYFKPSWMLIAGLCTSMAWAQEGQGNEGVAPAPSEQAVVTSEGSMPAALVELVRLVLVRHPELVSAQAQSRAAASQLAQSQSQAGPRVELGVNAGVEQQQFQRNDISNDYRQLMASVRAVKPLLDPALTAQVAGRRQALAAADWQVAIKQEDLMLRTLEVYADVVRATQLLSLSQANLALHRDYVTQVKGIAKLDVGRASDLPVAQGRVALAESINTTRLIALEQARSALQSLTGLSQLPELPVLPLLKPAQTLEEAYQTSLSSSASLQLARAEIELARQSIEQAGADYRPRISLETSGKTGRDWGGVAGGQHDVYIGVRLDWLAWANGANRHAVQAATEQKTAADFAYEKSRDELRLRVTNAWYDFLGQAQALNAYTAYAQHAQEMVTANRQQFAIGRRSLLDVLNAENELFTARSNEVGAHTEQLKASLRLLALQGRLPALLGQ